MFNYMNGRSLSVESSITIIYLSQKRRAAKGYNEKLLRLGVFARGLEIRKMKKQIVFNGMEI